MNFQHTHEFLVLADELHFRRAADKLGISQSALTNHVRALEDELGAKLMERNRRAGTLTPAGAAFVVEARSAFEHVRLAGQLAGRFSSGRVHRARIGHGGAIAAPILERALPELVAAHPGIEIHLHEATTAGLLDALHRKTVDVALIRPPAHHPDIDEEHLLDEPLVAVVAADHPLAAQPAVTTDDLCDQPVVLPPRSTSPGAYERLVRTFRRHSLAYGDTAEGTSITSLLILVAAGLGITVLPVHAVRPPTVDGITAIPLDDPDAYLPLHLAWRKNDENPILFAIRKQLLVAARHLQHPNHTEHTDPTSRRQPSAER